MRPVVHVVKTAPSLPLMRKTFIEALVDLSVSLGGAVVSSAYAEDFH